MVYDFIIVGQGLAGTCLAITLIQNGYNVHLIDDHLKESASMVAAGIFNPIVFKRLTTTWLAHRVFPFADNFYPSLEKELKSKFYFKKDICRIFYTDKEMLDWRNKLNDPDVEQYISKKFYFHKEIRELNCSYGSGIVYESGYVLLNEFILSARKYFIEKGCLTEKGFEHSNLKVFEQDVEYDSIKAQTIVFCEGYKASSNPYFSWIPFKHTKGEVLTIKSETDDLPYIFNKNVFMLPLGNNKYKIGATFDWQNLDHTKTETAKNELTEKLEAYYHGNFVIVDHNAGIRPTINDRRPVIGSHPVHKNVHIFNGFGAKGVLLAPYFANEYVNSLKKENKGPAKEVDVARFYKFFG